MVILPVYTFNHFPLKISMPLRSLRAKCEAKVYTIGLKEGYRYFDIHDSINSDSQDTTVTQRNYSS